MAVAAVVGLLAACGSKQTAAPVTRPVVVPGQLILSGNEDSTVGVGADVCYGYGTYDDLSNTSQVIVRNGAGRIVAHPSLGRGVADLDALTCTFRFNVQVPPNVGPYTVTIGKALQRVFDWSELRHGIKFAP